MNVLAALLGIGLAFALTRSRGNDAPQNRRDESTVRDSEPNSSALVKRGRPKGSKNRPKSNAPSRQATSAPANTVDLPVPMPDDSGDDAADTRGDDAAHNAANDGGDTSANDGANSGDDAGNNGNPAPDSDTERE